MRDRSRWPDHKGRWSAQSCGGLRWSAFVLGEFHHCITRSRHDTAPRAKKHANRRLNCSISASSGPRSGRGTRSRRHCNGAAGQGGRHQSRAAAAARRGHRRRACHGMQADGLHVPESSDTLPAIADRLMEMIGCTVATTATCRCDGCFGTDQCNSRFSRGQNCYDSSAAAPSAAAPAVAASSNNRSAPYGLTLSGTQSKPTRLGSRRRLRPRPMLGCRSLARPAAWQARCPRPGSTPTGRASTVSTAQVMASS